jgi:NADH-quinone oxidoreductase subunit M
MQALANHQLSLILFTPLAGALLILLVGSRRVDAIRWMASGCAAATFALAIPLWFRYDPHGKTWQFAERSESISAVGVSYYVGVDGFSILLILLTALVAWIALVASWHEIRTRINQFYALILTLQAGLLGVFMSLDFLQIFLFWAAALVAVHLLIRTWGEGHPPRSATRFTFYMLTASLAVLAGILALYFLNHAETGVYTFDVTQFHTLRLSSAVQKWIFLAFLLGFGATLALFPLHSWLPDAQSNSPTAASLLLAAVMLKLGSYGFVRVSLPILPDASREFAPAMMVLALIAVAGGAVFAWVQRDWIRFAAYVSVSHMAFVTLGLFALTPVSVTGSMLHQINHGLATAGLLLIVAGIRQRTGVRDLALAGGSWRATPALATCFLLMTMALAGVPALNGFVGERMIAQGVYGVSKLSAVVAVVAMVLVSAYMLWQCRRTMFGRVTSAAGTSFGDLTPRELAILVPLVALSLWIGLRPAPFVGMLETSMGRVVARVNPDYAPYVAQGSDCATPAPPEPSAPPPAFLLTESCADGSEGKSKPSPPEGGR